MRSFAKVGARAALGALAVGIALAAPVSIAAPAKSAKAESKTAPKGASGPWARPAPVVLPGPAGRLAALRAASSRMVAKPDPFPKQWRCAGVVSIADRMYALLQRRKDSQGGYYTVGDVVDGRRIVKVTEAGAWVAWAPTPTLVPLEGGPPEARNARGRDEAQLAFGMADLGGTAPGAAATPDERVSWFRTLVGPANDALAQALSEQFMQGVPKDQAARDAIRDALNKAAPELTGNGKELATMVLKNVLSQLSAPSK